MTSLDISVSIDVVDPNQLSGQCLPATVTTADSCTVVALSTVANACEGPGLMPISSAVRSVIAADLARYASACDVVVDTQSVCTDPYDDATPHWCSVSASNVGDLCSAESEFEDGGPLGADVLFSSGLKSSFARIDVVCLLSYLGRAFNAASKSARTLARMLAPKVRRFRRSAGGSLMETFWKRV